MFGGIAKTAMFSSRALAICPIKNMLLLHRFATLVVLTTGLTGIVLAWNHHPQSCYSQSSYPRGRGRGRGRGRQPRPSGGGRRRVGSGFGFDIIAGAPSLFATTQPDSKYYSFMDAPLQTSLTGGRGAGGGGAAARITLTRYLDGVVKQNPDLQDMVNLLLAVKMACKTIGNLVNRAALVYPGGGAAAEDTTDGRQYSMQRLDQLSTIVLKNALKYTGQCEVVALANTQEDDDDDVHHHHQPGVLIAKSIDSNYVACLDPLDGSGNADASICTGTIFGFFEEKDNQENKGEKQPNNKPKTSSSSTSSSTSSRLGGGGGRTVDRTEQLVDAVLQPGRNMKAAGYCLFSSATVFVFTLGGTVQGFTLDPLLQEFVLTHPNLTIPSRGNVYSCNEANSEGWEDMYKKYLRALKTGTGQTETRYVHRYVGTMVGDVHRTLLYGGIFAYPSDSLYHPYGNLQLLYKIAPMAFVVHKAGGVATNGQKQDLLDLRPGRVHEKSPCFLGSPEDIAELESYLLQSDNGGEDDNEQIDGHEESLSAKVESSS